MYKKDLISVIIPTRGRTDTLLRSIESVLNQSYRNLEVFVVDDNDKGSDLSKQVAQVLENFADPRVKLVIQETHKNGAAARNTGIKAAQGEYIAFLDDDDWWESRKLEHQKICLSSLDATFGLVTCLTKFYLNGKLRRASVPYRDGSICKEIASRCIGIGMGAPLIKRTALDETGYFDESLTRMQDVQLFTFLCSRYKVRLLTEYLYCICGDDNSNRKNLNIPRIKEEFLKSIQPVLEMVSKRDRDFILTMQNFDMGYSFCKARKYKTAIPLLFGVFKRPEALFSAVKRVVARLRGRFLKRYNIKKYRYQD